MFRYTRWMLSVLGMAGAVLSMFRFDWVTTVGLDFWNVPGLQRDEKAGLRRGEELTDESEIVLRRIAAKEQVVRELMAQRLTLFQAAATFRRLNSEPPDHPAMSEFCFTGKTENERLCRQVLNWVEANIREFWAPSQVEELLCRLEAELAAHLASHGGEVVLPDY